MTSYQRLLLSGCLVVALLNAITWLIAILWFDHSATTVILHYNIYFGPDGFGSWYNLLTLPMLGTVIGGLDLALAVWLWSRDRFLSYVATVTAALVQAILLTAISLLIQLNWPWLMNSFGYYFYRQQPLL